MIRYLVQIALLIAVATYALRCGGKPERQTAIILIGVIVADSFYHAFPGRQGIYDDVDFAHAIIDFAALAAMMAVALRADRFWTLWLGALQLIASLAHVLRLLEVDMLKIVYAIIIRGPYWAQIALLGFATWNYRRNLCRKAAQTISRTS